MLSKKNLFGVSVLTCFIALTGCDTMSTKDAEDAATAAPVEDATSNDISQQGATTAAASVGGAGSWTTESLENPNSPLYIKTVYFDFDQSSILPEYQDILRNHAEFLVANPNLRVTVEGHCDERGTREYNIALGENRANSVVRFLENLGVSPDQLSTVSYGEERPVAFGANETAWAQNRRAVLAY